MVGNGGQEQMLKGSLRVFMGRFADQVVDMNDPAWRISPLNAMYASTQSPAISGRELLYPGSPIFIPMNTLS
jgi:hypothetical protein